VAADDPLGFDETPFLEPAPDDEAWEAYLEFAMDRLDNAGSRSLTNRQLDDVEAALGIELPFEIGLLLVIGVPEGEGWWDWRDDPAAQLAGWNQGVLSGIQFDIRENEFWSTHFGPRPDAIDDRLSAAATAVAALPQLFPIHGHSAVPATIADGFASASGNPVLSIVQTDVIVYADDLAGFLHRDFGVPLPLWQKEGERRFTFWSDLTNG
jgi:hypothetical protein